MEDVTKEFLKGFADKLGYKLVNKDKSSLPPMMPPNLKDYSKLSSDMLIQEIKVLDDKISQFQARNERLRICTITFMEQQQPDHTKVVFDGSRFESSKMIITDMALTKYANLKNHLEALLKAMLSKEMTAKFMELNPEFKDKINNIEIRTTATGDVLFVIVSEEKPTKANKESVITNEDGKTFDEVIEDTEPCTTNEEKAAMEEVKKERTAKTEEEESAKKKAIEESEKINKARKGRFGRKQ